MLNCEVNQIYIFFNFTLLLLSYCHSLRNNLLQLIRNSWFVIILSSVCLSKLITLSFLSTDYFNIRPAVIAKQKMNGNVLRNERSVRWYEASLSLLIACMNSLCRYSSFLYISFCVGMKYLNQMMLILDTCRVITDKLCVRD